MKVDPNDSFVLAAPPAQSKSSYYYFASMNDIMCIDRIASVDCTISAIEVHTTSDCCLQCTALLRIVISLVVDETDVLCTSKAGEGSKNRPKKFKNSGPRSSSGTRTTSLTNPAQRSAACFHNCRPLDVESSERSTTMIQKQQCICRFRSPEWKYDHDQLVRRTDPAP